MADEAGTVACVAPSCSRNATRTLGATARGVANVPLAVTPVAPTLTRANNSGSAVAEDRPNASKLRGYLDRRMRVTMSDGRVIMGRFMVSARPDRCVRCACRPHRTIAGCCG